MNECTASREEENHIHTDTHSSILRFFEQPYAKLQFPYGNAFFPLIECFLLSVLWYTVSPDKKALSCLETRAQHIIMLPTGCVVLLNIRPFQNYTHRVLAQQDRLSGCGGGGGWKGGKQASQGEIEYHFSARKRDSLQIYVLICKTRIIILSILLRTSYR